MPDDANELESTNHYGMEMFPGEKFQIGGKGDNPIEVIRILDDKHHTVIGKTHEGWTVTLQDKRSVKKQSVTPTIVQDQDNESPTPTG